MCFMGLRLSSWTKGKQKVRHPAGYQEGNTCEQALAKKDQLENEAERTTGGLDTAPNRLQKESQHDEGATDRVLARSRLCNDPYCGH
jgi:hypothetical protein